MNSRAFLASGALFAGLVSLSVAAFADDSKDIQILRPASTGPTEAALDVLKRALAANGYAWKEVIVSSFFN